MRSASEAARRCDAAHERRRWLASSRVDRFLALSDRAIRHLERLRRAAQARDISRSAAALEAYVRARNAARAEADRIGLRC